MSSVPLRTELAELIAKETNNALLKVLHDILTGTPEDALLKAKLTSRALKAEEDLGNGRVHSIEDVRARLAAQKKK